MFYTAPFLPKDYDDIPFLASSKRTEISSFEKVIFSFFAFSIKARTRGIISSELFPSESFWKSFKSLSFFRPYPPHEFNIFCRTHRASAGPWIKIS